VDTWKDNPSDKVTLNVQMQSLADGTDYPGAVVLAIPSSNIQVRITNSNYQSSRRRRSSGPQSLVLRR